MKTKITMLFLLQLQIALNGQKFTAVYPVSESPNIQLMSKMNENEPILFEAQPTVRFNLYNDFQKSFLKNNPFGKAFYISFRPHLRMYNEISKPVKTPSYRIYLASQWIWSIPSTSLTKQHYIGFMMESGHYSNGQARCAFSNEFEDEESSCKTIYENITEQTELSDILNRNSGNYSTNLTEIVLQFSCNYLNDDLVPYLSHTLKVGYTYYHDKIWGIFNVGGYSDYDIELYGRHRLDFNYKLTYSLQREKNPRIWFEQKLNYIVSPHKSVNPFRSTSTVVYFPFENTPILGFHLCYILGHDNYNYRFVDSGSQLGGGLTIDLFPPIPLKNLD